MPWFRNMVGLFTHADYVNSGDSSMEQRRLVDAQKYQMMDLAVQPAYRDPVVVVENQR